MKNAFVLYLLIIFSLAEALANDGVFYSIGNTLIPLDETTIELKKEVLILTKNQYCNGANGDKMDVSVYFEFYNPGEAIERVVGFVTPPADGAMNEEFKAHPYISDYIIEVNNSILFYDIARIDSTEFKTLVGNVSGNDFIYYSTVKFQNGITIIKHSYTYKGSQVADMFSPGPHFHYRLTTGNSWANKEIEDFEIYINMGKDSYFSIPAFFENNKRVNWELIGSGKTGMNSTNNKIFNVKINSGYLHFTASNFKPDFDLTIRTINPYASFDGFVDIFYPGMYNSPRDIGELSDSDLRILRNSFFAIHGYSFNSHDLHDYFSQYIWYIPDPNINEQSINLNQWEQDRLDKIIAEENRR